MAWPDYIEGSQQSYLKKVPLPSRRPPILPFHKIGKMSIFLSKQTNKQTNKQAAAAAGSERSSTSRKIVSQQKKVETGKRFIFSINHLSVKDAQSGASCYAVD
jgi:hypothetical protein